MKRKIHLLYISNIPTGQITVEVHLTRKHSIHVCHIRDVPLVDFDVSNIELDTIVDTVFIVRPPEQIRHVCNQRCVYEIQIGIWTLSFQFLFYDRSKFVFRRRLYTK